MSSHDKKYHVTLNDVIQIVFIILKLCKLINWSWWVVLTPIWVSLGCLSIQGIIFMERHKTDSREESQ